MKGSKPTGKRSLVFRPVCEEDLHLIPSRLEMSLEDVNARWYDQAEIKEFKDQARYISRKLRADFCAQHCPSKVSFPLEEALEVRLRTAVQEVMALAVANDCPPSPTPPEETLSSLEDCDFFLRGLELRVCPERQLMKRIALRSVLKKQEKNKEDTEGLGHLARRLSFWASSLAYDAAIEDARVAAWQDCSHDPKSCNVTACLNPCCAILPTAFVATVDDAAAHLAEIAGASEGSSVRKRRKIAHQISNQFGAMDRKLAVTSADHVHARGMTLLDSNKSSELSDETMPSICRLEIRA